MSLPTTLFSSPNIVDDFSVVYKNKFYRTLGLHRHTHPQLISEFGKMKPLPAGWLVCSVDPDALKVCSSFSWQCEFLVFADGSAAWTSGSPPHLRVTCNITCHYHHHTSQSQLRISLHYLKSPRAPPAAPTAGQSPTHSILGNFFGANSLLIGREYLAQHAGQYAPAAKDGGWVGDVMLCRTL